MGYRIAIAGLSINTTERLVVIRRSDRKDTPHLTLSFQNASGEIDFHFKYESPLNDGHSTYKPLLRIRKEDLELALQSFFISVQQAFLQVVTSNVRRVRPGWLGRHGYIVAIIDEEAMKKDFLTVAPKLRGKHRINEDKLKLLLTDGNASNVRVFSHSILHDPAIKDYGGQVLALRMRRNRKHEMIGLYHVQRGANKGWVMADSKIVHKIQTVFDNSIPPSFRMKVKDIWHKIFDELRLDELGLTKD